MKAPTFKQIADLRAAINRQVPWHGDRRTTTVNRARAFVAAMRERGWLSEEGYAPDSWAAKT